VDDLVVVDEEETLEHLLHHLLDIACAHKDRGSRPDSCFPDPAKLLIRLGSMDPIQKPDPGKYKWSQHRKQLSNLMF
jgi:hypothetical protein